MLACSQVRLLMNQLLARRVDTLAFIGRCLFGGNEATPPPPTIPTSPRSIWRLVHHYGLPNRLSCGNYLHHVQ